jgi:Cu+-exporting ATPase
MPYVDGLAPFMTSFDIVSGTTLYVFINFIVSSIIQFVLGKAFYVSAYKSLKHKSANMDVLIVIGTSSAWVYGVLLIGIGYSDED